MPAHAGAAAQLRELLGSAGRSRELRGLIERMANAAPPGRGRAALLCELAQLRFADGEAPELVRAAYSAALEVDPSCAQALAGMRELATATREPNALLEVAERELALEPPPARAAELLRDVAQSAHRLGRPGARAQRRGALARARALARSVRPAR